MTRRFLDRIKIYKRFLVHKMRPLRGIAYKQKLTTPTAREIAAFAAETAPGLHFTNVARDIRTVTEPGEHYDAEFDLLYRGQTLPYVIENYSEKFLARMVKDVIAPSEMSERLADAARRYRPDGRPVWEAL